MSAILVHDTDLVALAAGGDGAAFSELVVRHQDRVYAVAMQLLRDPSDAEEIAQETFLAALGKLPGFRGDAAFSTWLHRVAANAALMRLRKRRRSPEVPGDGSVDDGLPRSGATGQPAAEGAGHDWSKRADEQLSDRQVREAIESAVRNLPEAYRDVFVLRDVEGLPSEAMAEVLGISVGAVKSRLHRARLALRAKLATFLEWS